LQLFALLIGIAQPKVYDSQVFELIKQKILWLYVSVSNSKLPYVFDTGNELLKYPARFLFS